jgi:RNA 2',3'-cyclic 3'-phosphodiesterase
VRLFVALDCDKLHAVFPSARWVRTEGIHVTLKFIGEMKEDRLSAIESALATVKSSAPVEMKFRGTGFFPDARRPRVLWVGIEGSPNLLEIVSQIETRLEPLGIARESREFKPHLTLARIQDARGIDNLHDALRRLGPTDFGSTRTHEMHLYQSQLGRGGARYIRLKTFDFSAIH